MSTSLSPSLDGPARGAVRFWRRRRRGRGAAALGLAAAALVAAPLMSLAVLAAAGDAELWPHLSAYVLPDALAQTALLLIGVAILAGGIGAGTAFVVTTFEFSGRGALLWLLPLPLAIPTYIAAYIYVDIFEVSGPLQSALRLAAGWRSPQDYWFPQIRSLGGAVFVFSMVLYPYVYLAARAMLQTQSSAFAEAARSLGAGPFALLRNVTLPMARPALAVGLALALLETLNDIGASEYLGVRTLTYALFTTWLNRGSIGGAAQIALVMLAAVTALIALERHGRRRQGYARDGTEPPAARIALKGRAGAAAALACLVPPALGFLLPAGFLLHETLQRGLITGFDPALLQPALATVTLATVATVAVVALAAALMLAQRLTQGLAPQPLLRACTAIASLGYAVPGTVLALGLLTPLVLLDNALGAVVQAVTGAPAGLIVIGSGAALVIAYVIRFLAIGTGLIQAGLTRVAPEFDDAARLAGARPLKLARRVHLPLIRPALWGAALLVFVDCLKELPATLMLRPMNVETLSTYIYQFATRGSFEEGSLAALLIVAAGIVPVIRIVRQADLAIADLAVADPGVARPA